jgi:hypothetical protein
LQVRAGDNGMGRGEAGTWAGLSTHGHQCRRRHAQLSARSASMPGQELRRRAQWSAAALMANAAAGQPFAFGSLPSGPAAGAARHTRYPRSVHCPNLVARLDRLVKHVWLVRCPREPVLNRPGTNESTRWRCPNHDNKLTVVCYGRNTTVPVSNVGCSSL